MLQALIFDVDGTLADTEEMHRQAFNLAFRACGLDWSWDPALYGELLRVTGGKERIASYIERLRLPAGRAARLHDAHSGDPSGQDAALQGADRNGAVHVRPGSRRAPAHDGGAACGHARGHCHRPPHRKTSSR